LRDRRYWNLLLEFTISWFKLRDQGSLLGFLWTLLHPLMLLLVLYLLFRHRLGTEISHFGVYLLIGIIHWSFFATATGRCVASLVNRDQLVQNVSFARELLVFSDVGSILISFALEMAVLLFFVLLDGLPIRWIWLMIPVIVALEAILVCGISLILACAQVFVQDVERIWSILLRIGFFLVPIFYSVEGIDPVWAGRLLEINPLTQIMTFSRDVLISGSLPSLGWMAYTLAAASILFFTALRVFRRAEPSFTERV
jgi:ABC-type polysaccharide/polyol phosphate export permease